MYYLVVVDCAGRILDHIAHDTDRAQLVDLRDGLIDGGYYSPSRLVILRQSSIY